MSKTSWMIACCVMAMLIFTGCSSDDVKELLDIDPEGETAEVAVEGVLNDVIDPLATALDLLTDLVTGAPVQAVAGTGGGLECPNTEAWCGSGSAACVVGGSGLEFTFASCSVSDGMDTATFIGGVNVAPPTALTLVSLVVNGGMALNGTVTYSGECDMNWNINAADGTITTGTIVECDSDENPQSGSSLLITAQISGVGTVQMAINFNGTSTANASVTVNGAAYATCSVNLDTYDASCDGV